MNPYFFQTMLERVRKDQPHSEHAIQSIQRLTDVGMSFGKLAKSLEADRNLTPTGARSKLAETIRTKTLAELAAASRPVRKALSHTEAQRAGLTLPKVDRTDQVGEMRRKEIRDFLRSLPAPARRQRAEELAKHPEGQSAVFDMPDFMSGLDDASLGMPESKTFERMKAAAIHELHGSRLAEIDGVEADYREVEAVAVMVRNELFKASGMSREGFEAAMQPLEAAGGRLMKFSERRARQRARGLSLEEAGDLMGERLQLVSGAFAEMNDTVNAISALYVASQACPAQDEALKVWAIEMAPVLTRIAGEISERHEQLRRIFEPNEAA